MSVELVPLLDEGLGNSAYLVDLGDGRALAVDASRDLRALRREATRRGLTVAFAAETHLHADFLSGAHQLASDDGARLLASAAGERQFPHEGLRDGDDVDLGGLRLRALGTPGHTHEHLSFLLLDGDREVGVFSGGSLLVGAAARTDLVSPEQTEALARAQYRSLQRLIELPDATAVWPTHGAGSFCSAVASTQRTTTIGQEKASNTLLAVGSEDAFVTALLDSLGSYPAYFDRLGEVNRLGPALLYGEPALPRLTAEQVVALHAAGAAIVDTRPVVDFAAGHVPGAVSIALREVFATWLGALVPIDAPVVIVRGPGQDASEVAWQAAKIGYQLAGELSGGMDAWATENRPQQRIRLLGPEDLDDAGLHAPGSVLDIRQAAEYGAGHVPGALHHELGALAQASAKDLDGVGVVMCGHGERAMSAASLLTRRGLTDIAVLTGGPQDWARSSGKSLEEGL